MNENNQPQSQCPKCGKGPIIMFTADDDICQACGKIITPERQPSHSPTEQPGDAKHTSAIGRWNKARALVSQIPVVKANFQHIAETGVINGTLLDDLTRLVSQILTQSAELKQLRSERDKMRERVKELEKAFLLGNHPDK